jgi:Tol biopolymer transport system component
LLSSFGQEATFSPDGKQIAFWTGNDAQFTGNKGRIYLEPVDGGDPRQLVSSFLDARHPTWNSTGNEILFEGCGPGCSDPERQRDWWRIGADGLHPVATGALRAALRQGLTLYFASPAWQNANIYFSARMTNDTNIWRIAEGRPFLEDRWKASPIMSSTEEAIDPSLGRDGSVAFAGVSAKINLWLAPLSGRGSPRRLSLNIEIDSAPSISRDGQRILYFRRVGNERRMILRETDGVEILNVAVPAGTRGMIAASGAIMMYTKPRDGLRDLYQRRAPEWRETLLRKGTGGLLDITGDGVLTADQSGISVLNLRTGSAALVIPNGELTFDEADVSADGNWIAYVGDRDPEHSQLFVAPYAGGAVDTRHAQTIAGAEHWNDKPRWTADGRAVVYVSDRDGFTCIWKQQVSPAIGIVGSPQAVVHFHREQLSPAHLSRVAFDLSVSHDSVLYNAGDLRSNIWIARPEL